MTFIGQASACHGPPTEASWAHAFRNSAVSMRGGLGMGDPQRAWPGPAHSLCSQRSEPLSSGGEVVFAPDSAFSSATGCDINALGGSKGGCESQKRTQRETTFPEHLLVPCTISFMSSNSVRRSIIFGL